MKRVSQNKGSHAPGIDGAMWNTDACRMSAVEQLDQKGYRAKPLRRIYIRKKNVKLRPLGIPRMIDSAQQALYLLALEPISETVADLSRYGFHLNRRTAEIKFFRVNMLLKINNLDAYVNSIILANYKDRG